MHTGLPRVPGHEIVGQIVAVGTGENHWKVGQRVGAGWHGGHCSVCKSCLKGDFLNCESQSINGVLQDGGYAEYATLRREALVKVPEDMDPAEIAPLFCAGVTTFNPLRHMKASGGDVVAVQGVGGLGHLGVQFCRAMGFYTVALSTSSAKKDLALELGAHEYVDGSKVDQAEALQKLGGAKVILATAPDKENIHQLVNGLCVDGQLVVLALTPEILLPAVPMVSKRLSVIGWPCGGPSDVDDCIKFAKLHKVKARIQTFPLAEVNEAYASMAEGRARFRAVLVP